MRRSGLLTAALVVIVIVESAVIAYPSVLSLGRAPVRYLAGAPESYTFQFQTFNWPVTNNSELELKSSLNGSWTVTIRNTLRPSPGSPAEAQMAFAPSYPAESKSIPTIIIQERADGLLRVEYFAQSWPNTFGLVLYNSTSESWAGGTNVTLRFVSFGPPSAVNPPIAPRSNGNLTVLVGSKVVVSDYPIAWASLGDVYLYGLAGTSFQSGTVSLMFQSLTKA